MKALIILAALLASTAFADQAAYVKLGDIKGETTDVAAQVIDEEANAVEDVKAAGLNDNPMFEKNTNKAVSSPGLGSSGQDGVDTRGREKGSGMATGKRQHKSAQATDYNSSRSNRTTRSPGNDETHTPFPTTKREAVNALDDDDDADGLPEVGDEVIVTVCTDDEGSKDCDDAEARALSQSYLKKKITK
jgi:hypothetical protein